MKCTYCGEELNPGSIVCSNCGTMVSEMESVINAAQNINSSTFDTGKMGYNSNIETQRINYSGRGAADYIPQYGTTLNSLNEKKSKAPVIIASVAAALTVIVVAAAAIVWALAGSGENTDLGSAAEEEAVSTEAPSAAPAEKIVTVVVTEPPSLDEKYSAVKVSTAAPKQDNLTYIERTMYVGNCSRSITLRTEPSTDGAEICQIPYGASIYVIGYVNDQFALVTYSGKKGYAMRSYILSQQPQAGAAVADKKSNSSEQRYSDAQIEEFVKNSLIAFVDGINSGDGSYVNQYYSSALAERERKTFESISSRVESEKIISLSCSLESRTERYATVVRKSTIEVVYNDQSVKSIPETYVYTVDISGSDLIITELEER